MVHAPLRLILYTGYPSPSRRRKTIHPFPMAVEPLCRNTLALSLSDKYIYYIGRTDCMCHSCCEMTFFCCEKGQQTIIGLLPCLYHIVNLFTYSLIYIGNIIFILHSTLSYRSCLVILFHLHCHSFLHYLVFLPP